MSSFLDNMLPIKNFASEYNSTSGGDKWPADKAQAAIDDIGQLLVALTDSLDCALAYSRFLSRFTDWITSLDVSQRNVSSSVDVEQSVIRFNRDEIWLRQTVVEYTGYQITKTELANLMLGDRMTTVQQNGDNAVSDVNAQIVAPLETFIVDVQDRIVTAYEQLLEYLFELYSFTGGSSIETHARSLRIWRKPVPNLELPTTIHYGLSSDQTWQIWLKEVNFGDFVSTSASSRLSMLVGNYFSLLNADLSQLKAETRLRQTQLVAAIEVAQKTLQDFADQTKIDETFIRSNLLVVNIFSGELKTESIQQSPSYVWLNYFSDMGSYFGLLMGTSILTLCEIIDLMVYHSFVKVIERYEGRKRRRRDVIDVDNNVTDTKETYSDEENVETKQKPMNNGVEINEVIVVETET